MPVHIDKENTYIPSSASRSSGKRIGLGAKTFGDVAHEKPAAAAAVSAAPRTILGEKSTNVGLHRVATHKRHAGLPRNVNKSQLARKSTSEAIPRPLSAGEDRSLQPATRASSSGSIRSSLYPRPSFPLDYANLEPEVYYPPPPALPETMHDPVDYARLDYRMVTPKVNLPIDLASLDEVSDFEVEFSDSSESSSVNLI